MNVKPIAVALAAMLTVVGGAAAVTGTGGVTDAGAAAAGEVNVATTYTNGTVTVEVTRDGTGVEGATVEVAGEEYTTDANGTVTADDIEAEAGDELGVEVETDGFEAELSYTFQDGDLTLLEEEYEYERADEDADRADEDENEARGEDDETETDEETEADGEGDEDTDGPDEAETEKTDGDEEADEAETEKTDEQDDD